MSKSVLSLVTMLVAAIFIICGATPASAYTNKQVQACKDAALLDNGLTEMSAKKMQIGRAYNINHQLLAIPTGGNLWTTCKFSIIHDESVAPRLYAKLQVKDKQIARLLKENIAQDATILDAQNKIMALKVLTVIGWMLLFSAIIRHAFQTRRNRSRITHIGRVDTSSMAAPAKPAAYASLPARAPCRNGPSGMT